MAKQDNRVRYQVVAPCFVNGSRFDPKRSPDGGPVFVMAEPGLEGKALKLAPAGKPAGKAKPDGNTGQDAQNP